MQLPTAFTVNDFGWTAAAFAAAEFVILIKVASALHRALRDTPPPDPARYRELPPAIWAGPGTARPGRSARRRLLALTAAAGAAGAAGLYLHRPGAPRPATPPAPPAPAPKAPPAVVHPIHWPLSGTETLAAIIVVAVLIAAVRITRARSR